MLKMLAAYSRDIDSLVDYDACSYAQENRSLFYCVYLYIAGEREL